MSTTFVEKAIVVALICAVLLLVATIIASFAYRGRTEQNYRQVCEKVGGEAVWDRRQWQCIKP